MRQRTIIAAPVLMAALAVAAPLAQESIHEEVPAARDARVEIDNLAGTVTVTGWSRDRVEVTGTLGRGSERLEVKGSGSRISIRVVLPEQRGRNESVDVEGSDLEIRVPAASRVLVQTVSASIDVSGMDGGETEIQTVSGSVRLADRLRRVELNTVSGGVDMDGLEGLESADLNTVSGNLTLDGSRMGGGRFRANSVSGNITVRRAGNLSADWDVSTFSGRIDNQVGPAPERHSPHTPGQSVSFSTGGGASISLNTFSGRVEIRRD